MLLAAEIQCSHGKRCQMVHGSVVCNTKTEHHRIAKEPEAANVVFLLLIPYKRRKIARMASIRNPPLLGISRLAMKTLRSGGGECCAFAILIPSPPSSCQMVHGSDVCNTKRENQEQRKYHRILLVYWKGPVLVLACWQRE